MISIYSMLFALLGSASVVLFHVDIYFPIWLSVGIFILVTLYLLKEYRNKRLGILMILIWLVYALPFVHIPPYLFFDFSSDPSRLWGMVVNPYMVDQRTITLTAMIGAVGGIGIGLGASFNRGLIQQDIGLNQDGSSRKFHTIAVPIWLVWVVSGVALSALSAPEETVFAAAYTTSKSAISSANFSSAWMMSYVILSFAFCDALLERATAIKYLKMKVIFAAIITIVVFFQFLRGDRESVPWIFGLALVNYYWAAGLTQKRGFSIPWLKIGGVAVGLVFVSMVLGSIRSDLTGASVAAGVALIGDLYASDSIGLANALHGTWSATLLTPLSVAGDHVYGLLPIKWGQDYVNLFLSIIPGFLADAIGYIRPIDAGKGPAWEMRYGLGGTHAAVVPFMNFRMLGVFLIPTAWTLVMVKYEKMALKKINAINLSLLLTIALASPHWLWYGEKNGFNAIILWIVLAICYRVSVGMSRSRALLLESPKQ